MTFVAVTAVDRGRVPRRLIENIITVRGRSYRENSVGRNYDMRCRYSSSIELVSMQVKKKWIGTDSQDVVYFNV